MTDIGLAVEELPFTCLDWTDHGSHLVVEGQSLTATTNPFSPACDVTGQAVVAGSRDELMALDLAGKIVVLFDALTAEAFFPKHFPFLTLEEQQSIIRYGDHTLFWPRGVPCLAFSSRDIGGLINNLIHTPCDTLDMVNLDQIAMVIDFMGEAVRGMV
jgi:Iap family predicted aminopeptidase